MGMEPSGAVGGMDEKPFMRIVQVDGRCSSHLPHRLQSNGAHENGMNSQQGRRRSKQWNWRKGGSGGTCQRTGVEALKKLSEAQT